MSDAAMSNPKELEPFVDGVLQVVVETPRGSRAKYAWDEDRRCFTLKKLLPEGMVFPFDFGFVPQTKAEDGGAIDVLLLLETGTFPGCVVPARLIGVIEQEDHLPNGTVRRNDRLLAVAEASHQFANIEEADDLPEALLAHLQAFFESYPRLLGEKESRVLGVSGAARANELLTQSRLSEEDRQENS